jgi:5-enolpyruvylshikimate-3-phosphate synthase
MVGNTGILGTETLYTNSTKTVRNGTVTTSYVVEPDTSSTAIINLIGRIYNASGTLTQTEQDRYRINATGNLTPVSANIQYSNTTNLVLTF